MSELEAVEGTELVTKEEGEAKKQELIEAIRTSPLRVCFPNVIKKMAECVELTASAQTKRDMLLTEAAITLARDPVGVLRTSKEDRSPDILFNAMYALFGATMLLGERTMSMPSETT